MRDPYEDPRYRKHLFRDIQQAADQSYSALPPEEAGTRFQGRYNVAAASALGLFRPGVGNASSPPQRRLKASKALPLPRLRKRTKGRR